MSTALSGYMKWCVVLLPTSASNPAVVALFILYSEERTIVSVHRQVMNQSVPMWRARQQSDTELDLTW
jgi:hypothetical protein